MEEVLDYRLWKEPHKKPKDLVRDMISPNERIKTPARIRPSSGKWIECPKCYGMPNQANEGHCEYCKDKGTIRE
jgi:hypothetical protein